VPRNTHLYENRIFTNKVRCSIILGQKEKTLGAKVLLKKINLFKSEIELGGHAIKDQSKYSRSDFVS